jgi:hypothetical protein
MGWMIQEFNPGRNRRYMSLLHNAQTGCGAHAASYSVDKKVSLQTVKWRWCEANSSLDLIVRLKNAALQLPILHAFKNWTGATVPSHVL